MEIYMNELVSVVITTYKREIEYIKEAIESVLNQSYAPIEVIVIDDNGENTEYQKNTEKLCLQYSSIYYYPNKINMGAQISRNNGITKSKGGFIAFLDDDDIWDKYKIEKQMHLFKDKCVGMVYCDGYSFIDGEKNKLFTFREASIYDRPITHNMELFNDWIGSTSQALIRRECFDNIGMFDPDMPARQDYEMWLRISSKYKIVGTPEKLLYYRIHPGERISTNWNKCFNSYQLILDKYKNDYNKNKYAKAKLILRMVTACVRMKKYGKAFYYLIYSFCCSPQCLFDVLKRKIQRKGFSEYYSNII